MWRQVGEQETGTWWTDEDENLSAFEDRKESGPRWYAWRGAVGGHDDAEHSPVMATLEQAIAVLNP